VEQAVALRSCRRRVRARSKHRGFDPSVLPMLLSATHSVGAKWTLVCTPNLIEGARTDRLKSRVDHLPQGTGRVTISDVAAFMLDEAVAPRHVRVRVGVNTASI
jgi:putative NADH-flavin reductase